ncbi:MAG TPA: NUDIX hydrolase [Myxococcota bacterium]|nr:NUDIX hydrolase [Myxococcota bacterium]
MSPDGRRRSPPRRALDAAARAGYRAGFPLLRLWWRVTHPTLEGVYVAVWHEERVLLIRNSYQTGYSFPSGRRGRAEPPGEAAVRELREEVGIEVASDALVHAAEWTVETRLVSDHVHVFELHLEAEPAVALDHREVTWAAFEPPERARERPLLPVVERYLAALTERG